MPTAHVALPPDRRTPLDLTAVAMQPGQVVIAAVDGPLDQLVAELGPTPPTVLQTSGWEAVPRPKKRSLVEWAGHDPIRVSFQVMLNAMHEPDGGRRVERACRTLERFAGAQHGAPPLVRFSARGAIPYDATFSDADWVIEQVDWGDSFRDRRGRRVRQFADLTMLQYVEDKQLAGLPAVMKQAVQQAERKYADVRAGESLRDVAARTGRQLGDLKKLNDIRDGDKTLKTGRRIRLQ